MRRGRVRAVRAELAVELGTQFRVGRGEVAAIISQAGAGVSRRPVCKDRPFAQFGFVKLSPSAFDRKTAIWPRVSG